VIKLKIYKYFPGKELPIADTVIALGFFDGVHLAHRRLIERARRLADERGLTLAVFTFPAESRLKGDGVLYSTEQKLAILEELSVEAVIMADFKEVADIDAEDFIDRSLIKDMHCRAAVAGFDFRFGKGAVGNAALLSERLSEEGVECVIEHELKIDGEKISTTKIKELLSLGMPEEARRHLGCPYFITARVEHGCGAGRGLGFPTANTEFDGGKTPLKVGVYRTAVDVGGRLYTGVTNVGTCPTLGERGLHAETYIVDYSGDLYDEKLRIFFLGFLRDEIKFKDKKDLILQINVDKNRAIKENGVLTWQAIGQS